MQFIRTVKGVEIAVDSIESVGPPRSVTKSTPLIRSVTTKSGAKHDVHAVELQNIDDVTIVPAQPGYWLVEPTDGPVRKLPIVAWAVRPLSIGAHEVFPVMADTVVDQSAIEYPDGRVSWGGIVLKNADALRSLLAHTNTEADGLAAKSEGERAEEQRL